MKCGPRYRRKSRQNSQFLLRFQQPLRTPTPPIELRRSSCFLSAKPIKVITYTKFAVHQSIFTRLILVFFLSFDCIGFRLSVIFSSEIDSFIRVLLWFESEVTTLDVALAERLSNCGRDKLLWFNWGNDVLVWKVFIPARDPEPVGPNPGIRVPGLWILLVAVFGVCIGLGVPVRFMYGINHSPFSSSHLLFSQTYSYPRWMHRQ